MSDPKLFSPEALAPPHRSRRARLRELLTTAVVVSAGVEAYAEKELLSLAAFRLAAKALHTLNNGTLAEPSLLTELLAVVDAVEGDPFWTRDPVWADLRAFR